MKKTRMNIYLDPKQKTQMETLSQQTGAPVAELVRRAVDAYLVAEHKQRQRRKP
jgi:predicted DNA-binding protein